MVKNRKKPSLLFLMSLFMIIAGFLNYSRILYAQENVPNIVETSNLSPELKIPQGEFSRSWRNIIIDSYMRSSILTPYEYLVLKLDILFNVKINPADIERSLQDYVSKEDMLYYFYESSPDKEKTREVRLKIRDKFQSILREHDQELGVSMLEYLEILMRKLFHEQKKDFALKREIALSLQASKIMRLLTDEEILLFKAQPSSLKEHALKRKIINLLNGVLVKEGVFIEDSIWNEIADAVEERKQRLLSQVRFMVNLHKNELKQRLCDELLLKEISYYLMSHPGFNIERQKARAAAFKIFMDWLKAKENEIETLPYFNKITLYKEGKMWEARYWVMLDEIMRELVEIDAPSYEMSLKKMLGRKITGKAYQDISRALDIVVRAEKMMLNEENVDYNTYHRIRSVNSSYVNNFLRVDEELVMQLSEGIMGIGTKVFGNLWFIDKGQRVLYQTHDKETGEEEFFVFSQSAPFIQVIKVKNDYARIYRQYVKRFIESRFSPRECEQFLEYSAGEVNDWDAAYNNSKQILAAFEGFFSKNFDLELNQDVWALIIDVMKERITGSSIMLNAAESEFLKLALPFRPQSTLMRLDAGDIIPSLRKPSFFELRRQNISRVAQAI